MSPGDIHWVSLPDGAGHEQSGRRPAIVLQNEAYAGTLPVVIVLPLTGATQAARFPGTLPLKPNPANGLRRDSVVLVFQIRAVDRSFVGERIGGVTPDEIAGIY